MHPEHEASGVPTPKRILIVRLSHLGDVVHALPVYHALRAAHPQAELAWAIQPEFASLVSGLPGITRVFAFGRRDGMGAWVKLRRELADWRADWAVDAQGNIKSAAVTWMSRARRRTGLDRSEWAESWGAHVLTEQAPRCGERHAVARMFALARFVGGTARFDVASSADELRVGAQLFEARMPQGDSPGFILHLAKADDVRSWPWQSLCELAEKLRENGARVVIVGGPAELPLASAVRERLSHREDIGIWIERHDLRALAGFFAAAAAADVRVVACDSGPAHIAAASGARVTLLAGPQDAERTGPWPPPSVADSPHQVITTETPPECMPCLARQCAHADGPVCMTTLSSELVARALGYAESSVAP